MNSLSTGGMFIMMIPKLNPVTSAKTISIFITRYLLPFDPLFFASQPDRRTPVLHTLPYTSPVYILSIGNQ